LVIGDIGIGNNITLATFNRYFGFTKMDAGEIAGIRARVQ
jgi:hypothetical protein